MAYCRYPNGIYLITKRYEMRLILNHNLCSCVHEAWNWLRPSSHKNVTKTSWKRPNFGLKDVLDLSEMEVATTFLYDVVKTSPGDVLKTSWRRLKEVLKTFSGKSKRSSGYHLWTFYLRTFWKYIHITTPSLEKLFVLIWIN